MGLIWSGDWRFFMRKHVRDFIRPIRELKETEKKNFFLLAFSFFFVYFTYPFFRATSTALFIENFGGQKTPVVWLLSIGFLSIIVMGYNSVQKKWGPQKLFSITSIVSALLFLLCYLFIYLGIESVSYIYFIWKEVYIVLIIHMLLGYANSYFSLEKAKLLYGPIGAIGSLGGIAGGIILSSTVKPIGVSGTIFCGVILLIFPCILFHFTSRQSLIKESTKSERKESPLRAVTHVKEYVFWIVVIVSLSQFCINILNLKFNLIFAENVQGEINKAQYLGNIYTIINALTLFIQLVGIPILFRLFTNKKVHLGIPLIYLLVVMSSMLPLASSLWGVAGAFIFFKGMDYSLFSTAKEFLYFPLSHLQKFGAKYLTDMIAYRMSKGVIAFVLIYIQSAWLLNTMLVVFLISWFLVLLRLFYIQKVRFHFTTQDRV